MRIVIPLILSLVFAGSVQAKHLTVGVEEIFYKPIYWIEDEQYTGFSRDVLDAFAEAYGHQLEYVPLPLARLYDDFLSGAVNLKFPDSADWRPDIKNKNQIHYSEPMINFTDGTMVKPENLGNTEVEVLATVLGFEPFGYLHSEIEFTLVESRSFTGVLTMVMSDRADGAYANVDIANYYLREVLGEPGALVFDESLPHGKGGYSLSSIDHPEIVDEFNEFLKKSASLVAEIKTKHGM